MCPLASDPFSPPRARDAKSKNPKTVANRKAYQSKTGLDIAEHRADVAFRSSKSRKLSALHRLPQWASWSEEKKEKAEADIIRDLEKKGDDRKRQAEVALFLKWEKEGVEPTGEHSSKSISDMRKNEESNEEKEEREEEEEEREEEEEEDEEEEEHELYHIRRKGNKRRRVTLKPKPTVLEEDDGWSTDSDGSIATALAEVLTRRAKLFFEQMSSLEVKAEESAAELAEAMAGANQV